MWVVSVEGAVVAITTSKGQADAFRDELPAGVFVEIYPERHDDISAVDHTPLNAAASLAPTPASGRGPSDRSRIPTAAEASQW